MNITLATINVLEFADITDSFLKQYDSKFFMEIKRKWVDINSNFLWESTEEGYEYWQSLRNTEKRFLKEPLLLNINVLTQKQT